MTDPRARGVVLQGIKEWGKTHPITVIAIALLILLALETAGWQFMVSVMNPGIWIFGQILLAGGFIFGLGYVVIYGFFFEWRQYGGGRIVFSLTSGIAGLILLSVLGIFIDPRPDQPWYLLRPDVLYWRPTLRVLVYLVIDGAYAVAIFRMVRSFFRQEPINLDIQPKPRRDLDTGEIKQP